MGVAVHAQPSEERLLFRLDTNLNVEAIRIDEWALSPDGTRLLMTFTAEERPLVIVTDLNAANFQTFNMRDLPSTERPLIDAENTPIPRNFRWSPDGSEIAVAVEVAKRWNVPTPVYVPNGNQPFYINPLTMDVVSENANLPTPSEQTVRRTNFPGISDGRFVYIYENLVTGERRPLIELSPPPYRMEQVAFAPDGSHFVYQAIIGNEDTVIYRADADGRDWFPLLEGAYLAGFNQVAARPPVR